jgi:hypothetical protein
VFTMVVLNTKVAIFFGWKKYLSNYKKMHRILQK